MQNVKENKLNVNEIFYSLQGEGKRTGEASLFIRLQGCKTKNACYSSGIQCDTEFESGEEMYLVDIVGELSNINYGNCEWIVWTGGEPLDQLDEKILIYFKELGYKQALETSGLHSPPDGFDWIVLSPKVAEHTILKKWKLLNGYHCDEVRWVRRAGQHIPNTKIKAREYYISPHFDGITPDYNSIEWCVEMVKANPEWKLSTQDHKYWSAR